MHKYSLGQIIAWWLHGLIQYVREVAPLINPAPESSPPGFWYDFFGYWEWYHGLKSGNVPGETLLRSWLWGTQQLLGNWIEETARAAADGLLGLVRNWTGWPLYAFPTLSSWIDALQGRIGTWVPSFASNLAQGVDRLWNLLPEPIRQAGQTFEGWIDSVREFWMAWARATYDGVISGLSVWADWTRVNGQAIKAWWDLAHDWLDRFRLNPRAYIASYLPDAWGWLAAFALNPRGQIIALLGGNWGLLESFAGGALLFWANLWGQYAGQIAEFWADPLGFIYNRAERFLIEKW